MGRNKGTQKTGGRTKGTPNKLDMAAREIFVATLENQVPFIEGAFEDVLAKDPAKYLELFAKYAQYFVPKKLDVNMGGKIITVIPPDKKK